MWDREPGFLSVRVGVWGFIEAVGIAAAAGTVLGFLGRAGWVPCAGGEVTVLATHPLPPISAEFTRLRNDQLDKLPAVLAGVASPILLVGDLNTSPWSYPFRRLLEQTGMEDSSRGRGVQATWPSFFPPLLIPIDHVLFSAGIDVTGKTIGPGVGSDHYPVIVDFKVRPM